jgi:hypothetical protein
MKLSASATHQFGDIVNSDPQPNLLAKNIKLAVDTYGGRVHVEHLVSCHFLLSF